MSVVLGIGLSPELNTALATVCRSMKAMFLSAPAAEAARDTLRNNACDVVFSLLQNNDNSHWSSLLALGSLPGTPDTIAIIDRDDDNAAGIALQSGAWDVLTLPVEADILLASLTRCLHHRSARNAQSQDIASIRRDGILGDSPILRRCLNQMAVAARSDSSILILGETGTGKELFARAVHDNSPRAGHPFVVVDCTNLPPSLAESILFGHTRGSFTGAVESTDGLFKQADGGSIFLDELGELDLNVQKSLLRVIQERRFRPLSAKKEIECDFRIIAATNRDLEKMVQEGHFRQDLFHRINTRTFTLPPLRDRKEDIPLLARHYTDFFCKIANQPSKQMPDETLTALQAYPWPGNIREMVNAMHAAVLNAMAEQSVFPQHLPEDIRLYLIKLRAAQKNPTPAVSPPAHPLPTAPARTTSEIPTGGDSTSSIMGTPSELTRSGNTQSSILAAGHRSEVMVTSPEANDDLAMMTRRGIDSIRSFIHGRGAQATTNAADKYEYIEATTQHPAPSSMQTAHVLPADASMRSVFADPASPEVIERHTAAAAIHTQGEINAQNGMSGGNIRLTVGAAYWSNPQQGEEKGQCGDTGGLALFKEAREKAVSTFEAAYLHRLAKACHGDFTKAMHFSGLSRARLYELLKKHDISI